MGRPFLGLRALRMGRTHALFVHGHRGFCRGCGQLHDQLPFHLSCFPMSLARRGCEICHGLDRLAPAKLVRHASPVLCPRTMGLASIIRLFHLRRMLCRGTNYSVVDCVLVLEFSVATLFRISSHLFRSHGNQGVQDNHAILNY